MAVDANDDSSAAAAEMEDSLRSLVQYYLENLMHANATFLGERLVACNPREENVLLLATCHVMNKSKLTAHALLQGCRLPESRFLLAYCCIDLGKLAEAERVLLEGTGVLHKGPKEGRDEILAEPCPIPHGAAGLRLLGLACQGAGRRESAEHYFRLSLELDPLLWVNIQSLCELGVELDVDKHFEEAFFKGGAAATAAAAGKGPAAAAAKGGSHRQAGGPAAAAAVGGGGREGGRQRRTPWAPYLALCGGNRGGASCRKGENTGRRSEKLYGMAPPPPPPPASRATGAAGAGTSRVENSRRSVGGGARGKDMSVVGGGALFGTPTPSQARE
ncbi:unnamed protein product [Ectocarpus sp. 12 AP-2014]